MGIISSIYLKSLATKEQFPPGVQVQALESEEEATPTIHICTLCTCYWQKPSSKLKLGCSTMYVCR